jgi:hypothetical protein
MSHRQAPVLDRALAPDQGSLKYQHVVFSICKARQKCAQMREMRIKNALKTLTFHLFVWC